MLQPFEVVTSKLLPTIRARLAQVLLDEYKMRQVEVAKNLGITQAAVSHYKTASRGIDPELVKLFPEIDAFVTKMAARIANGMPQTQQVSLVHELVERLMNTQRFCEYHKRIAAIDPACAVCFPTPPKP
jgi:predicted transcriptional regulator